MIVNILGYITCSLLLCSVSTMLSAENSKKNSTIQLSLRPSQCVSLNQGQTCYTKIKLHWQSLLPGNYCLMSSQQEKALKCWGNQASGDYQDKVALSSDVIFSMVRENDEKIVAQKLLEIAWVYKKARRGYAVWRMF